LHSYVSSFTRELFFYFPLLQQQSQAPSQNGGSADSGRRSVFQKMTSALMNVFSPDEPAVPNFEISAPYNFKHTAHVQIDPHTSTGFSVRNKKKHLSK
jgi:hypothetical protein